MEFFNLIVLGSVLSLIVTNFVVGTFFSTEMSMLWILIGIYIMQAEKSISSKNGSAKHYKKYR